MDLFAGGELEERIYGHGFSEQDWCFRSDVVVVWCLISMIFVLFWLVEPASVL